jgi:hypothetical protein
VTKRARCSALLCEGKVDETSIASTRGSGGGAGDGQAPAATPGDQTGSTGITNALIETARGDPRDPPLWISSKGGKARPGVALGLGLHHPILNASLAVGYRIASVVAGEVVVREDDTTAVHGVTGSTVIDIDPVVAPAGRDGVGASRADAGDADALDVVGGRVAIYGVVGGAEVAYDVDGVVAPIYGGNTAGQLTRLMDRDCVKSRSPINNSLSIPGLGSETGVSVMVSRPQPSWT